MATNHPRGHTALRRALDRLADIGVLPDAAPALEDTLGPMQDLLRQVVLVEVPAFSESGNPDVLPELDLGVQKGIQKAYRLRKLPTPAQVLRRGARWAPYRTVASWYMWRVLEL